MEPRLRVNLIVNVSLIVLALALLWLLASYGLAALVAGIFVMGSSALAVAAPAALRLSDDYTESD